LLSCMVPFLLFLVWICSLYSWWQMARARVQPLGKKVLAVSSVKKVLCHSKVPRMKSL
jgi:hypothetical protein